MIVQQFYLKCLAHASYVIGDEATGIAAVIDPQRDVDLYLQFAKDKHLRIQHVFLTHLHADFLAGHLELRDACLATIYLGRAASAEYAFTPLGDDDRVDFGTVRLQALETPGHTPESISLLLFDKKASETEPRAVFTGDTLFVGDVGRPDLRASLGWSATDLGGMLYDSVRTKLLALPDASLVYPAHGAGSLCGKALSRETVSTIGEQRMSNYALQPMTKTQFIDLVTADQPDAPAYFTYDAVLNSKEHQTLAQSLSHLHALTLDEVLAAQKSGAQVMDTREAGAFAAAHLKGTVNVGLVGQYATWAGSLLNPKQPIVIVADPGTETESAVRLGRIGFDNVLGYLRGGLAAAESHPELVASTNRLSPLVTAERTAGRAAGVVPVIIDVRAVSERAAKRIEGSLGIPLNHLEERVSEIPRDRPLIVHCAGGYRSSMAASLLQRLGFADVAEMAGGLAAWEAAGLALSGG